MEFTPQTYRGGRVPAMRPTPPCNVPIEPSTATSVACFVEFRQARDRLLAQFEPAAPSIAPAPEAHQRLACEARFARWVHPLETSLSWLISAAALGWVLLAILGL